MKSRPTQFGAREHTASPRQHASRLQVGTDSHAVCIEEEMPDIQKSSPLNDPQRQFPRTLCMPRRNVRPQGTGEEMSQKPRLLRFHEHPYKSLSNLSSL